MASGIPRVQQLNSSQGSASSAEPLAGIFPVLGAGRAALRPGVFRSRGHGILLAHSSDRERRRRWQK